MLNASQLSLAVPNSWNLNDVILLALLLLGCLGCDWGSGINDVILQQKALVTPSGKMSKLKCLIFYVKSQLLFWFHLSTEAKHFHEKNVKIEIFDFFRQIATFVLILLFDPDNFQKKNVEIEIFDFFRQIETFVLISFIDRIIFTRKMSNLKSLIFSVKSKWFTLKEYGTVAFSQFL